MKTLQFLFAIQLLLSWNSTILFSQSTYYVDQSTATTGNGTISQPYKTITEATEQVNSLTNSALAQGVTIYVKAGNYGNEQIEITKSGTADHPITIQGYQDTPNDQPTYAYDPFNTPENNLILYETSLMDEQLNTFPNGLPMPLLDGGNRRGIAFKLGLQQHIVIKNFLLTRYQVGVQTNSNEFATSSHIVLENIIGTDFYNDRNLDCYPCEVYQAGCPKSGGVGLEIYGEYQTIRNCILADASNINIAAWGSYNQIINCKSYGTKGIAINLNPGEDEDYDDAGEVHDQYDSPGYYIEMAGTETAQGVVTTAVGGQMIACLARRREGLCHGGHGIGIKRGKNMLIKDCTSIGLNNEGFYVFHVTSEKNVFLNCLVKGKDANGFVIRERAHDNYFVKCQTDTVSTAVTFKNDQVTPNISVGGSNNVFYNCLFRGKKGQKNMITFPYYNSFTNGAAGCDYSDAAIHANEGNIFANCVFDGALTLMCLERPLNNNQIINSIITNVNYVASGDAAECCDRYLDGFSLDYNNFHNSFSTELAAVLALGDGNISADPNFVDAVNGDYSITCGSPCVNAGTDLSFAPFLIPDQTPSLLIPFFDWSYQNRPLDCQYDIGIHELDASENDCCASSACEDVVNTGAINLVGVLSAKVSLTSAGMVEANEVATLRAGKMIQLLSGFHAPTGSEFLATIVPCTAQDLIPSEPIRVVPSTARSAEEEILVYPNPAQHHLTIDLRLQEERSVSILLYDQLGQQQQVLATSQVFEKGQHLLSVDIADLPPAIYLLAFLMEDNVVVKKLQVLRMP